MDDYSAFLIYRTNDLVASNSRWQMESYWFTCCQIVAGKTVFSKPVPEVLLVAKQVIPDNHRSLFFNLPPTSFSSA